MNYRSHKANVATAAVAILLVTATAAFAATSMSDAGASEMSPTMRSIIGAMADAAQTMQ